MDNPTNIIDFDIKKLRINASSRYESRKTGILMYKIEYDKNIPVFKTNEITLTRFPITKKHKFIKDNNDRLFINITSDNECKNTCDFFNFCKKIDNFLNSKLNNPNSKKKYFDDMPELQGFTKFDIVKKKLPKDPTYGPFELVKLNLDTVYSSEPRDPEKQNIKTRFFFQKEQIPKIFKNMDEIENYLVKGSECIFIFIIEKLWVGPRGCGIILKAINVFTTNINSNDIYKTYNKNILIGSDDEEHDDPFENTNNNIITMDDSD